MKNRFMRKYHHEKQKREDSRVFRLFIISQFIHYGALFLFTLGGLFFIIIGLKAIFKN
jgi:hypothetical protein